MKEPVANLSQQVLFLKFLGVQRRNIWIKNRSILYRILSVHPFDLSFCTGKQATDIFMVPQNNKNCQYCRSPKHAAVDVDIHDIDDCSTGRENAGQRDDLKCR